MLDIRRLDDRFAVAPQIAPEDAAAIVEAGFTTVVCNRPDGEEPGQPAGTEVAAACAAAGLGYHAVPVGAAGMTREALEATARVLAEANGPVLAFCRSGTRSCHLWALARASAGADPDALVAAAGQAGYDLSGLRPLLAALAARG